MTKCRGIYQGIGGSNPPFPLPILSELVVTIFDVIKIQQLISLHFLVLGYADFPLPLFFGILGAVFKVTILKEFSNLLFFNTLVMMTALRQKDPHFVILR